MPLAAGKAGAIRTCDRLEETWEGILRWCIGNAKVGFDGPALFTAKAGHGRNAAHACRDGAFAGVSPAKRCRLRSDAGTRMRR